MASLVYFSILLVCIIPVSHCDSFPNVQSNPAQSLLETLRLFNQPRHQSTNPEGKEEARKLIKNRFIEAGMHVWSEEVVLNQTLRGENIVGMLKGDNTATPDDKIVIVAAHYDTMPETNGVDDNGSGVTAVLEAAKEIGNAKPRTNNTIMFVAFDFEENTPECKIFWPITCGSWAFVRNLTKYLATTNGTVNGALILETMINHNTSEDSQDLPHGFDYASPRAYQEIKNDSFRGNFLAVVGRSQGDKKLLSLIEKNYEKDPDYRAQIIPIPLTGKPSDNQQYNAFYRSDHYRFWNNDVPYSALMLTDTADHRGYMQKCYHTTCDRINPHVKDDDLEFLRRTINAVIKTSLELSEAEPRSTSRSARYLLDLLLFSIAILTAIKYGSGLIYDFS